MGIERRDSYICVSCIELTKLFNEGIARAKIKDDKGLESRLREKREYFLREVYEKDHNQAFNLLRDSDTLEISSDSDVLDGKRWEDHLSESFQKREDSPFPEYPPTFDPHQTELPVSTEVSESTIPFDPYAEPFYGTPVQDPDADPITTYCSHDWVWYEGAGTRPVEQICRWCGSAKAASK